MKKLMVLLAAVALAGISQAATMSWTILNMQAGGVENGWLVALYDGSTTFNYADAKAGTLTAWYTGTATASGTTIKASASGLNNPSGAAFSPGDSISMYAVIFKGTSIDSATEYMVSDVRSATVKANGANISVSFGSMAATTTANAFLNSSFTPTTAIPEPTSGLLMLMGLGALALRRRRA